MANINIACRVNYFAETGTVSFSTSPFATSASPRNIVRGDTVTFTFTHMGDSDSYTFRVSGFASGYWTDISDSATLPVSGSVVRTSVASASVGAGYIDTIFVSCIPGNGPSITGSVYIKITDGVTGLAPNPFDLGPNITGVNVSDIIPASNLVTVSGITSQVSAVLTGSGYFSLNNSVIQSTSASVVEGDKIQVFIQASTAWNTTTSVTLNIGGITDSISATTVLDPAEGTVISFPITSGTVDQRAVVNFFGGTNYAVYNPPIDLRSYIKGGLLVPNISKNAGVPTSGTLALRDFLGSGTSLYFSKQPKSQAKTVSTLSGPATASLIWVLGGPETYDFDVGYGPGMRGAIYLKYELVELSEETGVFLTSNTATPGTYNQLNTYVQVNKTVNGNTEAFYVGDIIIYVMSMYSPNPIVTSKIRYRLNFIGP